MSVLFPFLVTSVSLLPAYYIIVKPALKPQKLENMVNRMFIQNNTGLSQIQRGNGKTNKYRNFFGLLIIGLACLLPTAVHAQINGLKSGDRIKLSHSAHAASQRTMVGTIAEVSSSVITLTTKDSTYYITNSLIENLWVSEGKRRNTGRGALIGAITGGLVSGIVVTSAYNRSNICSNEDLFCFDDVVESTKGMGIALSTLVGGLAGAGIGAFIGSSIKTERWERLPLNVSVDMQPKHKTREYGLNPTLSLRFTIGK